MGLHNVPVPVTHCVANLKELARWGWRAKRNHPSARGRHRGADPCSCHYVVGVRPPRENRLMSPPTFSPAPTRNSRQWPRQTRGAATGARFSAATRLSRGPQAASCTPRHAGPAARRAPPQRKPHALLQVGRQHNDRPLGARPECNGYDCRPELEPPRPSRRGYSYRRD